MLTELQCRSAKAKESPYKLADANGLYLYVTKTGHRSWRLKYRIGGKEKLLTFGPYPEVSLKEARELRDEARRLLRKGVDPSEERKGKARDEARTANTFRVVAERWMENHRSLWTPGHAAQVRRSLEQDAFPKLGSKPIATITPPDVLAAVTVVQERGSIDIAHRLRGRISAVFEMAIAAGLADSDPAAAIGSALKPVRSRKFPALLKLEEARKLLSAVERLEAHPVTKLASRLLALTAVRPGVIRTTPRLGEFQDLDGDEPLWVVPARRMKLTVEDKDDELMDLLVPLSRQAADVIRVAQQLAGRAPFLLPGMRHAHKPMSDMALSSAYKRLPEFRRRHVPHGWRSTFSTIMNERALVLDNPGDRTVIDLMLAHKQKGVEAIYNRSAYMPRRRQLAQEWADMLLKDMPPAEALLDGPRH